MRVLALLLLALSAAAAEDVMPCKSYLHHESVSGMCVKLRMMRVRCALTCMPVTFVLPPFAHCMTSPALPHMSWPYQLTPFHFKCNSVCASRCWLRVGCAYKQLPSERQGSALRPE